MSSELEDKLKASIELVLLHKMLREGFDMGEFVVKDSGSREHFNSGMQRDTAGNKTMYDLIFDGPLLERLAVHLTKGAVKYEARNWMLANSREEMERFRRSAANHFVKWMRGDQDEDHMAAAVFNLNGYEYVRERLDAVR